MKMPQTQRELAVAKNFLFGPEGWDSLRMPIALWRLVLSYLNPFFVVHAGAFSAPLFDQEDSDSLSQNPLRNRGRFEGLR